MKEAARDALLRAETEVIVDPKRRPIEYWHREHCSDHLPIAYVRKVAADNKWLQRRHAFWAGVQRSWLKQAHVQLVQQRASELNETLDLRGRVYQLITPKKDDQGREHFPIPPKSWEGMIKAFAVLDSMAESKRTLIMGGVEPMLSKVEETADKVGGLPFTPDEMRSLAHGLLAKRRHIRRANLGIEDDDDEDDLDEADSPEAAGSRPGEGEGGVAGA